MVTFYFDADGNVPLEKQVMCHGGAKRFCVAATP
jgi:hypothetical protein